MQNDNLILHSLMLDMQIAYYWTFLFNEAGEERTHTPENLAAQEANATKACKSLALRRIKNKAIPKRLYVFVNAFALHAEPIVIIDNTYHLYQMDNPEEFEVADAVMGESLQ